MRLHENRVFARIALERVSSGKARGKTALPSFLPSSQPPGSLELDTEKRLRKKRKEELLNHYCFTSTLPDITTNTCSSLGMSGKRIENRFHY